MLNLNYDKKEIDKYGTIRYFLNGQHHRLENDGPAIEYINNLKPFLDKKVVVDGIEYILS